MSDHFQNNTAGMVWAKEIHQDILRRYVLEWFSWRSNFSLDSYTRDDLCRMSILYTVMQHIDLAIFRCALCVKDFVRGLKIEYLWTAAQRRFFFSIIRPPSEVNLPGCAVNLHRINAVIFLPALSDAVGIVLFRFTMDTFNAQQFSRF